MAHRRRIDEAFSPVATTIDSKKEEEQEGAEAPKEREGRMTFTAHLGELRTRMIPPWSLSWSVLQSATHSRTI